MDTSSYVLWRFVILCVVIADSIFLLVKIFGDEDLGDFKYLGSAFITSMCSVCVLGSIFLLQFFQCDRLFICILELAWTCAGWVAWFTLGIFAARVPSVYNCPGTRSACKMAALTTGLSFLNWFLLATLNVTLFILAVIQHKRGNSRIWTKAPIVDCKPFVATVTVLPHEELRPRNPGTVQLTQGMQNVHTPPMGTTSVPPHQAPTPKPMPPPISHPKVYEKPRVKSDTVNPATLSNGCDQMTRSTAGDPRFADGSDNV